MKVKRVICQLTINNYIFSVLRSEIQKPKGNLLFLTMRHFKFVIPVFFGLLWCLILIGWTTRNAQTPTDAPDTLQLKIQTQSPALPPHDVHVSQQQVDTTEFNKTLYCPAECYQRIDGNQHNESWTSPDAKISLVNYSLPEPDITDSMVALHDTIDLGLDVIEMPKCPAEYLGQLDDHNFTHISASPSRNNRTDYNIIILTPFADKTKRLKKFIQLLCSLDYPHDRISVALGQDFGVSQEGEVDGVEELLSVMRASFRDVTLYRLENNASKIPHGLRLKPSLQPSRRGHLARSRNELLIRAVKADHDWVIWLDADLEFVPPNLVQLLLAPNEQIVAPACVQYRPFETFDQNLWRETPKSLDFLSKERATKGDDFIMIEKYHTLRKRLVDIRNEGPVVPIDGVGTCCLLVSASCHRQGLNFPSFAFDSHIESEGLARMATKMGFRIYGLPFVQVFHDMEGIRD